MGKGSRKDIQMPETAEATVTQMHGGQVKELASLARLVAFDSPQSAHDGSLPDTRD
ncbi:hypothetical protein HB775_33435 (plasmid) [Rhizobium leguminosarum bv. trifolii]|nr:hypothetical protein HB775_33435 [Rhizobium leguminosarum bv. trifolii]